MGKMTSAILDKNLRAYIVNTKDMVQKQVEIHNTTPVATAALGRLISATSIMGSHLKGEKEKISVQISGDGPIKNIIAISNHTGNVKAYISNPNIEIYINDKGKLDVAKGIGHGELIVVRDMGLKEPYVGRSNLVSSEIAEDLVYYYMHSEQTPSLISLGVSVDEYGNVASSGGLFIQLLPDATEDDIVKLENAAKNLKSISTLLNEYEFNKDILKNNFPNYKIEIFEERDIDIFCDCSYERMRELLKHVGKDEIKSMIKEDGKAQLSCHYCNTNYDFSKEDLENILSEI
jgi:molecular chaperone Hsp33